jgi:putative sterol carrier protein
MAIFPSKEWVEEVLKAAERSEKYKEAAKEWEGDFLCSIESDEAFLRDMRRKEVVEGFISYVGMMTPEQRSRYRGTPLGDVFEARIGIPLDAPIDQIDAEKVLDSMSTLTANDLKGAALYCWADFWHGSVRSMDPVAPGEHEDAAFKLSGKYSNWKLLLSGQQDAVKLVMSRKLKLDGSLSYMMRRIRTVTVLAKEVFAGVPID